MRKEFPCGHVGKGSYCHRCRQKQEWVAAQKALRLNRVTQLQQARSVPGLNVDMSKLPQYVAEKAAEILKAILAGETYMKFHGKRLADDRNVISVPVGCFYRILLRDDAGKAVPMQVLSHEEYNTALCHGHLR